MQRYFIDKFQLNNNIIEITNSDVHHIKNVMRMKTGDNVYCCDEDKVYLCKINEISDIITLEVIEVISSNSELDIEVSVAQGLVRREKTEEVIRRLTELGCYKYIPVMMRRSIVKAKDDKSDRYNRIIKEASEQSQRNKLMIVNDILSFKDFIKLKNDYDLLLYAHVSEEKNSFKNIVNDFKGKKILILVGPEGGYDPVEVELLDKNGFKRISLGERILRTETAPLYIMSVLSYEFGEEK